jgi:hypothetical protein
VAAELPLFGRQFERPIDTLTRLDLQACSAQMV